jgi:hypothetical protein
VSERNRRLDTTETRHLLDLLADRAPDADLGGAAEATGAADHRVEDTLQVGWRRRDNPQRLGGDGLLLQRLRDPTVALLKLGVAPLQLREQARVLDGDHGLVRERLQLRDMGRAERIHSTRVEREHANQLVAPNQWGCHLG